MRALVLACCVVWGGCAEVPDSDSASRLRIAWSSDPATLDPAAAVDVVGGAACAMLYETLVTFDRNGEAVPGLAKSWTVSEDGLVYEFQLSEEARASDGTPIRAQEVVRTFERVLSSETTSPRAWVLDSIAGAIEFQRGEAESIVGLIVQGDHRLEIRLARARSAFLGLLAMPAAGVLGSDLDTSGVVSTGPWVLSEQVRDSHLLFRRNPYWHGATPAFEEVHVRILPDDFTRVAEFEVGRLDLLEVPAAEATRFRADPELSPRLVKQVALVTEYIGLNNEDPVLADARVRRALNHAVNVDLMLEKILEGRGVRSKGPVPPTLPGASDAQPFAFDPDRARSLLSECDIPGDWTLVLWQRPSPLASQVLEAIQADLLKVGVRAEIRLRDWGALKSSIDRGETQAFFINWYADYPDAENFLEPLFHSRNIGGGGNRARYRDDRVDSWLLELDQAAEPTKRQRIAERLDEEIHEAAPWIFLWHPVLEVCVSKRIASYEPHPVSSCERWLTIRPAGERAPASS